MIINPIHPGCSTFARSWLVLIRPVTAQASCSEPAAMDALEPPGNAERDGKCRNACRS